MRELTQKQADIYKTLFNPRDSQHLHKSSLETLSKKIKTVFGHDIVKHFLIPSKFYSGGENICYYLQNIVLYAAYMGAIANNRRWPSEDFCNNLAELGLTYIKLFFSYTKAQFTDDFCEYLRKTIIENFKKKIENEKDRLNEIIRRQFRLLAHKTSIRSTDPVTAYQQDKKSGTLSATNPMIQTFFYVGDTLVGASEKAFATDLVIRCQKMLLQYDFHLSADSKMNIGSIQRSQHDAVNNKARGYGLK
jgi:hypothetical protein